MESLQVAKQISELMALVGHTEGYGQPCLQAGLRQLHANIPSSELEKICFIVDNLSKRKAATLEKEYYMSFGLIANNF
jgi:hypothetical protein